MAVMIHTRVVEFSRNFGQTAAIAAGIDYAQGDTIVLLDADMQNDPADIPMMLEKLDQGFDVVSSSPEQFPHELPIG
jgi:glycosyltransferase involved in cell wall biosynthesis